MALSKISIENFKCFHSKQEFTLSTPDGVTAGSGLNIFIGENNSGKSAVFGAIAKIKENSQIFDEEKYAKKDVEIRLHDELGNEQIIKNIAGSANTDPALWNVQFPLKYHSLHFLSDSRVWKSDFNDQRMRFDQYRQSTRLERGYVDSSFAAALSTLEKENPEKKAELNKYLRLLIPSFSNWQIGASQKRGNYITYQLLNKQNLDLDYSVGSGVLNLFKIIYGIVDDTKEVLIVDEPEAYLHPKAQQKLGKLFVDKAKEKQIIIATHSPYIFQEAVEKKANLLVFRREKKAIKLIDVREKQWGLFPSISPTFSEINYHAYGLFTPEFHNELYGFVQSKYKRKSVKDMDTFLCSKADKKKTWKYNRTTYSGLTTYIRNYMHHPEQNSYPPYTKAELAWSTRFLLRLMKR